LSPCLQDRWPLAGSIVLPCGADIAAAHLSPVTATATGTVLGIDLSPGNDAFAADGSQAPADTQVVLQHAGGFSTIYAHVRPEPGLVQGAKVKAGPRIGWVDNSLDPDHPYLHYGLMQGETTYFNPLPAAAPVATGPSG
jgi:murein DD-endopeptidase MepM/ murein hydrolase activator NlpD